MQSRRVTARERRAWRALLQSVSAESRDPTPEDIKRAWGNRDVWLGAPGAGEVSAEDAVECMAPRGIELLGPAFVFFFTQQLPVEKQNEVNARTEEYGSYEEFQRREIYSPAMVSLLDGPLRSSAVIADSIARIVAARAWEPEIRRSPAYRDREKKKIDDLIWEAWGIQKREVGPPTKDDRNREWSRRMYLGQDAKVIAAKHNVSREEVVQAVKRHRDSRVGLRWVLRAAIIGKPSEHN